jgi:hypothetical protein
MALTEKGAAAFQPGNFARQKIQYVITHADPPVDMILVGSGGEIEAAAVLAGYMTWADVEAGIQQHVSDAMPGGLTPHGYGILFLTQTQKYDCAGCTTRLCACCDSTSGAPCIPFGPGPAEALNRHILALNDLLRVGHPDITIDAGFPLPDGGHVVDTIHHGPAGVEAKVAAVLARLFP